jgi:hypothetical protein
MGAMSLMHWLVVAIILAVLLVPVARIIAPRRFWSLVVHPGGYSLPRAYRPLGIRVCPLAVCPRTRAPGRGLVSQRS